MNYKVNKYFLLPINPRLRRYRRNVRYLYIRSGRAALGIVSLYHANDLPPIPSTIERMS
jgi:hypothetical protein